MEINVISGISPPHPFRLTQSTCLGCPSSYFKLPLAIYFTYGNVSVSKLFSQIIPPSPPTESKSLFFTSVSRLLPCMQAPGGSSGKESACQGRRQKRFNYDPWVRKLPWRREWQSTPVFLPGESHGQRSLVSYSPQGHTESDTTEATQRVCSFAALHIGSQVPSFQSPYIYINIWYLSFLLHSVPQALSSST